MSEKRECSEVHASLTLGKYVEPNINVKELQNVKSELGQLLEYSRIIKQFPLALVETDKLNNIFVTIDRLVSEMLTNNLSSLNSMIASTLKRDVNESLSSTIVELTQVKDSVTQAQTETSEIKALLTQIFGELKRKSEVVELEKTVLNKINLTLSGTASLPGNTNNSNESYKTKQ